MHELISTLKKKQKNTHTQNKQKTKTKQNEKKKKPAGGEWTVEHSPKILASEEKATPWVDFEKKEAMAELRLRHFADECLRRVRINWPWRSSNRDY